ncbi:hypothetical protein [Neisseria sp.]|uniref:hypothetical protein n=1 Tax=Neisseria sp. TaxID=192066 RepID=UPI0035A03304
MYKTANLRGRQRFGKTAGKYGRNSGENIRSRTRNAKGRLKTAQRFQTAFIFQRQNTRNPPAPCRETEFFPNIRVY